ncbi:hypothetical protein [Nonomuraea cypriaca]|nr:hypothetical protein [Nonomuraea cypriaca]
MRWRTMIAVAMAMVFPAACGDPSPAQVRVDNAAPPERTAG